MGLLSGLMGNATQVSKKDVENKLQHLLIPGEEVDIAFKLIRDMIVFTDKRLILIDKQGVTGKKSEYHTIPYKSIVHFSIETQGNFDLDAELKIWISGAQIPISKQFKKDDHINDVQKALAMYTVGRH